eukprot:m.11288 g.11288  ORF g.11288 m.11288 type:complete len:69 (-) comp7626_c0_seq1:271-477(-)
MMMTRVHHSTQVHLSSQADVLNIPLSLNQTLTMPYFSLVQVRRCICPHFCLSFCAAYFSIFCEQLVLN